MTATVPVSTTPCLTATFTIVIITAIVVVIVIALNQENLSVTTALNRYVSSNATPVYAVFATFTVDEGKGQVKLILSLRLAK